MRKNFKENELTCPFPKSYYFLCPFIKTPDSVMFPDPQAHVQLCIQTELAPSLPSLQWDEASLTVQVFLSIFYSLLLLLFLLIHFTCCSLLPCWSTHPTTLSTMLCPPPLLHPSPGSESSKCGEAAKGSLWTNFKEDFPSLQCGNLFSHGDLMNCPHVLNILGTSK